MVPFEVITNSRSRNYRAKSLLAQPRIGAPSTARTSASDGHGGEPARVVCAYRGEPQRAGPTTTHMEPICYALRDPDRSSEAETRAVAHPERRTLGYSGEDAETLVCSDIRPFKPPLTALGRRGFPTGASSPTVRRAPARPCGSSGARR